MARCLLLLLLLLSVAGWSGADTTEGQKSTRENGENGGKGLTMESWAAAMVPNKDQHSHPHSKKQSESESHLQSDPHSEQHSLSHPRADHSESSQHSHEHSGTQDTVESSNADIEDETHSAQTRQEAKQENLEYREDADTPDAKESDLEPTQVDTEAASGTKTSELDTDNSQIGTSIAQHTELDTDSSQTVDPSEQNSNPASQAHEGTGDLKSSQPAATSRLLLVSPPSDLKNQTNTRDLLTWRLKDQSLIQELTNRILGSEEEDADGDANVGIVSSGVNRSQTEAASKVVERRVAAPRSSYKRHNRRPCSRQGQRCASVNETMALRRRLMQELESSHNAPLPARIRYRLKKKPSIYTSKKPHSRFDIGVPDIYESEVTVRAKQRRRKRPLHTQSAPDDQHPEEDYGFAADRKFQQYVLPKKPQHIPLGALSEQNYADAKDETKKPYIPLSRGPDGDQSKGLVYRPPHRPPGSNQKRRPSGLVRRPTSAPHYFTTVPQRHSIQAHLPYRRPVSFKYTRTDPTPKHANPATPTKPQYTTEPYPSSTPHKSTSAGYSTPAHHSPTTHKHPSTASTEGYTKPPLEYVPPNNEYIPPKTPSKTSPHPPPSKATHPPEHYVPPNKDYTAPPTPHQTPKVTYAPPHAPSSAPENTYVPPKIPNADPPGKYVAPEAPKNEYIAPKMPHAEPPKEYVPPGNDYKPPEADYKGPPQHYVPPNKEYIPPLQRPHVTHQESPATEGSYTPPPRKYIPPEHEFGTNMRVPGKRRPPHRRRRPGKRRRKPHPTAPSDQYIPPSKEYAAPGTTSAAHPHPTKEHIEPPSTLYEKPKTEYAPPKTPDVHEDSIPATTVSSASYAAPHRNHVPPLHEYQTFTPAYIPPQQHTPSTEYVPPHIPPPQTTYNTPSSAYQAPLRSPQPPVREYSPPKTTALPGWLQNIKSSHPTTRVHTPRHSNPTVPPGYYSSSPLPIYHPPEVAYSPLPSVYHSTTPAYHPPELPHAFTTPHPRYSIPSHHSRPPINEYIPPNVNLHHPTTIPPHHSTLGPPYVTPGYELSSPRPTYVPPPPPALHHPIDPTYLPPQQQYVPPVNEYQPPPGYGPPPPGHAEVQYRRPTAPPGYPSSTGTPKPHYITILLPPEVTPVPAFGPPPPDYAPPKVDEYIPPSLPHESYVPPKYEYSPPASPKPSYAPPQQSYSPPNQDYVPPAKPVHTPKEEYVPPQTDYSPPASPKPDYTPPKQSYVPPTAPQTDYVPPKNEYTPPGSLKPDYVPPHDIPQPDYAPPKQEYSIPTAYVPPKNDYAPPGTLHPERHSPPKSTKPIIPGYVPPKSDHAPPTTAKPAYAPPHTSKPDYEPPKTEYVPPRTEYAPPVTDYTPPKTEYAPTVTDYTPPKTEYSPPKTDYTPPRTEYAPPKSEYVPPKTEYAPPQTEYTPPKNDYEPPKPGYVPPKIDHVPPKSATTPFIRPPHVTTYKPNLAHKLQVLQDFSYPGAGKVSLSTTRPPKQPPTSTTTYTSPVYFPTTLGPGYNDLVANDYPILPQIPPPPVRPPPHFALPPDDDYYYYDDDDDYYYDDDDDYYYYDDFDYDYYDDDDDYYYYYYDYESPRGHNSLLRRPSLPQRPHFPRPDPHLQYNIHENDILDFGYIAGIPGRAGRDYPILSYIPLTSFGCDLVADYPGYYADMEAGCQVFHICHRSGRQDSFLCPNGTVFNQKYFVCDWWYNFSCEDAPFFYPVNAAIGQPGVPLHRNAFEPDLRAVHSLPPRHLFQHPGTPTPAKLASTGPLHHQVAVAPHIG